MADRKPGLGLSPDTGRAFESMRHGGSTTIANILKRNGIEPSPARAQKTTWKEFAWPAYWELIVAASSLYRGGLDGKRAPSLHGPVLHRAFFLDASRFSASHPADWVLDEPDCSQSDRCRGRHLSSGKRYLIHAVGIRCSRRSFCLRSREAGTESVKLPPRSPNPSDSYAERFVRTIKESRLETNDSFRRRLLRIAVQRIHGPLSRGTQSSGHRQPAHFP